MYDQLLEWCSERQEGTWAAFREAHDWLSMRQPSAEAEQRPDSPIVAYNLQILGHLEMSWTDGRWAVAPAVISVLDNSGGNAVLVGARPRWLRRRLEALHEDPDPALREISSDVIVHEPVQRGEAPSTLYLSSPADELMAVLCRRLGLRFEHRASERLRLVLPSIDAYLQASPLHAPPPGFQPRRLTLDRRPKWQEVDDDHASGAYEYLGYGPPRYVLNDETRLWQADKWVVVYAELRRLHRQVLFYRRADGVLFVPGYFPMPLLFARCAALRIGLLPRFSRQAVPGVPSEVGPVNQFDNIPPRLFETIADRLGQSRAYI